MGFPWPESMWVHRRAAILVAVVGLIDLLLLGCCSVGLLVTEPAVGDLEQAGVTLPPEVTAAQLEAIARAIQAVLAVATVMLFVLPGLALLAMSPSIDGGSRGAVNAARVILWVQIALLGGVMLLNVVTSLVMLNPQSLVLTVIPCGALAALGVWTVRTLGEANAAPAEWFGDDDDEPWNSHLG